jgi:hypothetical protein
VVDEERVFGTANGAQDGTVVLRLDEGGADGAAIKGDEEVGTAVPIGDEPDWALSLRLVQRRTGAGIKAVLESIGPTLGGL